MHRFISLFLSIIFFSSFCHAAAFQMQDKMYIDEDSFKTNTKGDEFYIHVGNNVWLVTHSIHRDASGMFAYENNLNKSINGLKTEYERRWKCPYCYTYWPIGSSCQNRECPSKYK